MNAGPIFIGGLAHSGKTPLRLMLSGHPNIALTRRTYMWRHFYNRYGDLTQPANFERCLSAMLPQKHIRALEPDPERIRREFRCGPATYARLFALFHEHNAERLGKPRWGDQLGLVEYYADPIFAAFPNAVMIHMIRDPRERYAEASGRSQSRKGKVGLETARWLASIRLAQRHQQRYPESYKIIRYETLFAQPEATLKEICAFIGETYVPAMLTGEDAVRCDDKLDEDEASCLGLGLGSTAATNGSGRSVSNPELAFIQAYSSQNMLTFDYPLQPIQFSFGDRLLFYCLDWPANRLGMAAWHILESKPTIQ